jgi:hypothetical protein
MFKLVITCTFCKKKYRKESTYNNHYPLCKLMNEHNLLEKDNLSMRDMLVCMKDIAAKCAKMETKIESLTRQNMVQVQKLNDKDWLTTNCSPEVSFSELIDTIQVNEDNLNYLFRSDFISAAVMLLINKLEEIPDNFKRPIQAFEHRRNVFYAFTVGKGWCVLNNEIFENVITSVHHKFYSEFNVWCNDVQHKLNNDSFAIEFCKCTKKINGGNSSREDTLTKCFSKLFAHICLKVGGKIKFEFV